MSADIRIVCNFGPCESIPFEQIFRCYDKYNGIGDTLFEACFGDKRCKYHQKHTKKHPTKKKKSR